MTFPSFLLSTSSTPTATLTTVTSTYTTTFAPSPTHTDGLRYQDQASGQQRDLLTQIALSLALGLSAFLTFCVGLPFQVKFTTDPNAHALLGNPPEMAHPLCGAKAAAQRSITAP